MVAVYFQELVRDVVYALPLIHVQVEENRDHDFGRLYGVNLHVVQNVGFKQAVCFLEKLLHEVYVLLRVSVLLQTLQRKLFYVLGNDVVQISRV